MYKLTQQWMKSRASRFQLVLWTLLSLLVAPCFANDFQFGAHRIGFDRSVQSNRLTVEPSGRASLTSARFLLRVGGANFEAIVDFSAFSSRDIEIRYDVTAPDSRRAILSIKGTFVPLPLPDWQLKPIAEYANSRYTAAVSLFGEGPDKDRYFYIEYHPAFANRLLGLRLLQADIMFIDVEELRQPPRPIENGKLSAPPVGLGEPRFDDERSRIAATKIGELLSRAGAQSWVLTDVGATGRYAFEISGGQLAFQFDPYYHFWRADWPSEVLDLARRAETLTIRLAIAEAASDLARVRQIRASLAAVTEELKSKTANPTIEVLDAPIAAMRGMRSELIDLNPPVHEAVRRISHYAALFRGIKQRFPEKWGAFYDSLSRIDVPTVQLPNKWEKN